VLRVAYSRTFETPFNENLLLSSATGVGGLDQNVFGSVSTPIRPGRRNQFNTGFQQSIGKYLMVDADYFWKFTHGAYDFSTLLNTPSRSPFPGTTRNWMALPARVTPPTFMVSRPIGRRPHPRAILPAGGRRPDLPGDASGRAASSASTTDQAFQSTGNFRYQHKSAEWVALTWRYDSGLVVSGVPDVAAALALTAAQQTSIGFACNGAYATFSNPITTCNGTGTSKLLTLPQTGAENDDHNPDRVKPRNVFNVGLGTDNCSTRKAREVHGSLWTSPTSPTKWPCTTSCSDVQRYAFPATAHAHRPCPAWFLKLQP